MRVKYEGIAGSCKILQCTANNNYYFRLPGLKCRRLLHRAFQVADKFRKFVEAGGSLEPFGVVDGGGAGHDLARRDVSADAGLGGDDDSVADCVMAGAGGLSGEDDVGADLGGTGKTHLGAEQGVFADGAAVADLDEVVDLRSGGDAGFADGGAVYGGVGLNLYVVLRGWRGRTGESCTRRNLWGPSGSRAKP